MIDEATGLRLPSCRFNVFVKDGQNFVRDARGIVDDEPCESFREALDRCDQLNCQAVA